MGSIDFLLVLIETQLLQDAIKNRERRHMLLKFTQFALAVKQAFIVHLLEFIIQNDRLLFGEIIEIPLDLR